MSGFDQFVRTNPMSDKITVLAFHHVEFYCGDATAYSKRFTASLGVELVSKSDNSTGNSVYASYLMQSGQMRMLFTAPYHAKESSAAPPQSSTASDLPLPGFYSAFAADFFTTHGFGARAVAVVVEDVNASYATITANGGVSVLAPCLLIDKSGAGSVSMAEVKLYGDVVLRLLDTTCFRGEFLPNYVDVRTPCMSSSAVGKYGVQRFDHIVGNVWSMEATKTYIKNMLVRCTTYVRMCVCGVAYVVCRMSYVVCRMSYVWWTTAVLHLHRDCIVTARALSSSHHLLIFTVTLLPV
jgi:4-hydroxyphenylpyruvate dioxygenase